MKIRKVNRLILDSAEKQVYYSCQEGGPMVTAP